MENMTDSPFRSICKRFGADILITEFVSSEGLIRDASKSKIKMTFGEDERPIGIQIFGHDVNSMRKATELAENAKPDFIDINFGCPVKKVILKGAGAALLNDIPRMVKLTQEVVRSTSLPVTVKTRLGWDEKNKNIVEIAEMLQCSESTSKTQLLKARACLQRRIKECMKHKEYGQKASTSR